MSWIGPCWLLKIVPWYFLKGKTPHHMHKNLICPTQLLHLYHPPTFPIEAKQCGRKVYIILSGYWGGGSLHTTVNRTYNMHDAHITNETERFFSWLHTTIILTELHLPYMKKIISYWVGTEKVVGMLFMGAKRISMHSLTNVKWVSSSAGCT